MNRLKTTVYEKIQFACYVINQSWQFVQTQNEVEKHESADQGCSQGRAVAPSQLSSKPYL